MASKRQLEANRGNARRSTGPRTLSGKASSSRNALKHGLCAETIVIGDETPEQFEELREAVITHYCPRTALAHDAADRYAATLWRLRRIPAIEAALAEAARQQAFEEECAVLEGQHEEQFREETVLRWKVGTKRNLSGKRAELATQLTTIMRIGFITRCWKAFTNRRRQIQDELLSERPFQAQEKEIDEMRRDFERRIRELEKFGSHGQ